MQIFDLIKAVDLDHFNYFPNSWLSKCAFKLQVDGL